MPPSACSAGRSCCCRCSAWPKPFSGCGPASRRGADRRPVPSPLIATSQTKERQMDVILLERAGKLGQMGDVVRVKDGFARNFLLPQGKALRATKDSRAKFEGMKVQ